MARWRGDLSTPCGAVGHHSCVFVCVWRDGRMEGCKGGGM